MVERYGGKGGFGAIASDNTDLRQGRYFPHKSVTHYTDMMKDITYVRCLHCGQVWEHRRGDPWGSGPGSCKEEIKNENLD